MRGECITPRRGLPFITAALLLLSLFLNGTSGLGGEGYFKPPYKDYGQDTDGDTKFNFLDFDFSVQINVSGTYFVESALQNSSGGTIDTPDLLTISGTGTHALTLKFDGIAIYNSGENGPYTIKLTLYDWGFDICGSHTNQTQSYLYTEFQPPPAEFNPLHFDYGLDTNSNTLYDYLVAVISITVNTADTYKIEGTLRVENVRIYDTKQWLRRPLHIGAGAH